MDSTVLAALIGGVSTVVAGIGGAILARSNYLDKLLTHSEFPELVGSKWESTIIYRHFMPNDTLT